MDTDRKIARTSAAIYAVISFITAALFLTVATTLHYNDIARMGGAVWVLLLSFIITMPIVTTQVKRRMKV